MSPARSITSSSFFEHPSLQSASAPLGNASTQASLHQTLSSPSQDYFIQSQYPIKIINHQGQNIQVQIKPEASSDKYFLSINGKNVGYIKAMSQAGDKDLYNGRSHLWVSYTAINKDEQGNKYSKLLTQMAVELSKKMGHEGRVALDSWTLEDAPAGLIHAKNGFQFVDSNKQVEILPYLTNRTHILKKEDVPQGELFMPESIIRSYLNKQSLL